MNSNNGNTDGNSFVDQLTFRLQQKEIEYNELLQELRLNERNIVRTHRYIEQLKDFVKTKNEVDSDIEL